MSQTTIRLEVQNQIARVTLDGEGGNRLDNASLHDLHEAIRAADDGQVKGLVLTGANGDFCRGRIRRPGEDAAQVGGAWAIRGARLDKMMDVYDCLYDFPVPVVAVVEGRANGFGCALVAGCDIALGSETSIFSLPEMDAGSPPLLALSVIAHKVPPAVLLHMVTGGEAIGAARAVEVGLLSELNAAEEHERAVDRFLGILRSRPRSALEAVKAYARELRAHDSLPRDLATAMLALSKTAGDKVDQP